MKHVLPAVRKMISIFLAVLILFVCFAYAMFQGGFVSWFLFYSMLSIYASSFFFSWLSLGNIQIERQLSASAINAGDDAEVTISLTNKGKLPFFYLSIVDIIPNSFNDYVQTKSTISVFFFLFKKKVSYQYRLSGLPRGEYRLGTVEVKTGDIFGLMQKKKRVNVDTNVLIYPRYQKFNRENPFHHSELNMTGTSGRLSEKGMASGVRAYIAGDRLSSIDWKVSARKSQLMTKEFESVQGESYMIGLHQQVPASKGHLFEKAIEFAASLTDYCFRRSIPLRFDAVGAVKNNIRTGSTKGHYMLILRELARIEVQAPDGDWHPSEYQSLSVATYFMVSVGLPSRLVEYILYLQHKRINIRLFLLEDNRANQTDAEALYLLQRKGIEIIRLSDGN